MKIANAPVSWGVTEFKFAGQSSDYARVLDEIRASGYQGTELGDWGFLPTDPQQLRVELAARNLELAGAFVPVNMRDPQAHEGGARQAARTAGLMAAAAPEGRPVLVLADDNGRDPERTALAGSIGPEHELDSAGWDAFIAGAELIARRVREQTGLRTVFHHHCAGFVETPAEVRRLLEGTDEQLLGLCLDTGHYRFGGGDPVQALDRYLDRIWHVHFKDFSPGVVEQAAERGWDYFEAVKQGVFCELGQGDVDFPTILTKLNEAGYDGWIVVEQDVLPGMGAPRASAERSRAYLEEIGLPVGEQTRSASA